MIILGIFIAAVILLLVYMYLENKRLVTTRYDISSDKLSAEDDCLKFVMLSDLHNNKFGDHNNKLIQIIKKENPDAVMIAGDMLVGHTKSNNSTAVEFIKQLSSEQIIYYGNGNHEQRLSQYPETCNSTYVEYTEKLKQYGVWQLINEKKSGVFKNNISSSDIMVYGLEIADSFYNKLHRPKLTSEYLDEMLGKPDQKKFNILIAHNPMFFKVYAEWGADLVLSGHVHGGIVKLPLFGGVISPQYILFPEYDYGEFHFQKSTMILSSGLGMHTIKLRLFNPPEVVVITLKNSKNKYPEQKVTT